VDLPEAVWSPKIPTGTLHLFVRLAKENPNWGYRRIHGEPTVMGIGLAASSVWNILQRHDLDPSSNRGGPSWGEFLKSQATTVLACDVFTIDTVLLKHLYVLFFIELDTRKVFGTGITDLPTGVWVVQQARNLANERIERNQRVKFLIRDRATKFAAAFDEVFRSEGIRIIRTPVHAPRTNASDERFVGTIRRECPDRMLIVNRRHLELVIRRRGYVDHHDGHRPHWPIGQLPTQSMDEAPGKP
jgi:putative transposase